MKTIQGTIWIFGDGIDTDIIIPARYLILPLGEMKEKAMEPYLPSFASEFKKGEIIVAGRNFGCGSSREQAPAVLKALGTAAIVAESFARIFYRNAINLGIPLVECKDITAECTKGDSISIDLSKGLITLPAKSITRRGSKLPGFLLKIIEDGGLVNHLRQT
jgi:3-isopropylmalate dehydratase small subunit